MHAELMAAISAAITNATGDRFTARDAKSAAGRSIHASFVVSDGKRRYFVKTGDASARVNFSAEADGLARLAATATLRLPDVICLDAGGNPDHPDFAFLVLEYLPLAGNTAASQARLGASLANLHRAVRNVDAAGMRFGLERDNFIGTTAQRNGWCDDWVTFFRERRLRFQLQLAARNGHGGALQDAAARLLEGMPALFAAHAPQPSLLHGDLWSGNAGALEGGTPVVFDPAAYCGDREADLAMTELFGGFGAVFYEAYDEAWPRDPGYAVRRDLYNLYHVLNHLNLFGAAYLGQAQRLIAGLNAELA